MNTHGGVDKAAAGACAGINVRESNSRLRSHERRFSHKRNFPKCKSRMISVVPVPWESRPALTNAHQSHRKMLPIIIMIL